MATASLEQEVASLNNLIEISKKNLENQKQLLEQLRKYKKIQDQYLQSNNDNEILFQLVVEGHKLAEGIRDNHLTDLFSNEFMGELNLVSQVATKRGIPKP